jgi:hypothetical protein
MNIIENENPKGQEEEERTICHCNNNFDIRVCCWIQHKKTYNNCPMKVNTTYWRIMNDYDLYNKIEKEGISSIKDYIVNTCLLNEEDWNQILEWYKEEDE